LFKAIVKVSNGVDNTDIVRTIMKGLENKQVYVGIPEGSDNDRAVSVGNAENSSGITNAELLYIQTHGVRQAEMRAEMNPKVESGEMPYSKAYQMYLQSHGSPLWHSPPRPVIEPAIEHSKDKIAKQLQKAATTALDGLDPSNELEKAGMMGQNIVRAWFTDPDNGWPANAETTIDAKGSERPLIDTGEMRKAIIYVVSDGK
jgi:hypothetical protein